MVIPLIITRVPLAILMICVLVWSTGPALAAKLQVPAGTKVELKFDKGQEISSGQFSEGDKVPCSLAQPLLVGTQVVVPTGATGTAVVTEVEKSGRPGDPGKIRLEFTSLNVPENAAYRLDELDAIPLSEKTPLFEGKGRKLLSYLLGFGLIIKGSDAKVPVDTVYTAKVAETVYLISD